MLAEAVSIAQSDQQGVLVRNASLMQGIKAATIPPQGMGDKQMKKCHSQGSMGGDGVSMLQRVIKTDDPSSQGLGDKQMTESRSQCSMGKGDISQGHLSSIHASGFTNQNPSCRWYSGSGRSHSRAGHLPLNVCRISVITLYHALWGEE